MNHYDQIERAIIYIKNNFQQQPDLEIVAQHLKLSPFHFQRLFKQWAGVNPKKFLQYTTLEYAKNLLKKDKSLLDVSLDTGLSGTSRLHDLFVTIEGMTPGEYKNGARALKLNYSFHDTPFGKIIIASTPKGICHLSFCSIESLGLHNLKLAYPNATLINQSDQIQRQALKIFTSDWTNLDHIKLHLYGTPFQLKVWQALLTIPFGSLTTYSSIAQHIDLPKSSRAVGTAIGHNPVAYLIPCHRVIRATGITGQYRWGAPRKTALFAWEAAQSNI